MSEQPIKPEGGLSRDDVYLFYCIWKDEEDAELAADKYDEMQRKYYGEENEPR